MTLDELKTQLATFESSLSIDEIQALEEFLVKQPGVFPFNEWEYRLMFLRDRGKISFQQYEEIRTSYVGGNKYLHLFGMGPRNFGEIWGQSHIKQIDPRFLAASKMTDEKFAGEYDLALERIKVEVKAARAIDTKGRGDLVSKALKRNSDRPFWMNFQQLKPDMCDVFLFIGVWVDQIYYWVMTPEEARINPYFSSQHRGGIEYQIGIKNTNIHEFEKFRVEPELLVDVILQKIKV